MLPFPLVFHHFINQPISPMSLREVPQSLWQRRVCNPNFLRTAALDASSPTPSKQKHQTVRLSDFDIVIDIASPTSPNSNALLSAAP